MKTNTAIEHMLQIRKNTIVQLHKHEANVNAIPIGFSNSLIWNATHNLVTLQLLAYKMNGLEMHVSTDIVDRYKKGTLATVGNNIDLSSLTSLLISTADLLKEDYSNDIFKDYQPYTTSFGITLNSIEEVISFNNLHEGLHLGYMMAMTKSL
jgi:hypothetical protein